MPPQYEVRTKDRIRKGIARYTPILRQAAEQGTNEANTSAIVHAMLAELREALERHVLRGDLADIIREPEKA